MKWQKKKRHKKTTTIKHGASRVSKAAKKRQRQCNGENINDISGSVA